MTITKGLATWVGLIGAAAGVLIPMVAELRDAAAPLGVPPQTWVILAAVLAVAVVLGRMAQAVALIIHPPVADDTALPEEPPAVPTDVTLRG
jgi:hypothetical protein